MTASTMLVLQLLALIYIQYDAAKVTANEPRAHLGYQNADSHQLRTSASNDNPNTRKLCTFDEFVPGNDDLLPYERCYEVKFEEGGGCRDDHDCSDETYCFHRNKGDGLPPCCDDIDITTDINYCVLHKCTAEEKSQVPSSENGTDLGGLCFSGRTTVRVIKADDGRLSETKPMKDLEVGDRVQTASGLFESVYAFAHHNRNRSTVFLQIRTANLSNETSAVLEITGEHLVYLANNVAPVRADSLQIGDTLQSRNSKGEIQRLRVVEINSVTRKGVYAPLTQHGTILVGDGIVASNYIAVQQTTNGEYVELPWFGRLSFLSQADAVHIWLSPFRLVCSSIVSSSTARHPLYKLCAPQDGDGMPSFVSFGLLFAKRMEAQMGWLQILVFVVSLCVMLPIWAIEVMFEKAGLVGLGLLGAGSIICSRTVAN